MSEENPAPLHIDENGHVDVPEVDPSRSTCVEKIRGLSRICEAHPPP